MSEFDQLYRELILDHYKNPRNHGLLDPADAQAEGQNPLCGDEILVSVRLDDAGVIEEVGFDGRGCAISQAATSMLSDLVKGRTAEDVAAMPKEELLDELGIPLTPVRLKCAILGLGVLKLALHKARGTPLPEEWGTSSNELVLVRVERAARWTRSNCVAADLARCLRSSRAAPGEMRLVEAGTLTIGVYNCAGKLHAIEDRCSHDDGPLCEGDWEPEACVVVCPRHGSRFDLESGIPMSLPAFEAVPIFPVSVREDGVIVVEVPD